MVSYGSTSNKYASAEDVRPAVDLSLADALGKQAECAGLAGKAAEVFLRARDEWEYAKRNLDQISEQVTLLRQEQDRG